MGSNLRDLIVSRTRSDKSYQKRRDITRCVTVGVDFENDSRVKGRPYYIWVKEYGASGAVSQVFNRAVKSLVGVPVLVSVDPDVPYRKSVLGVDWDGIPSLVSIPNRLAYDVPTHAVAHEWQDQNPGADPLNVYPRAIAPLRVYPTGTGLTVEIAQGWYKHGNDTLFFIGQAGLDLSTMTPASSAYLKPVLVYLDAAAGICRAVAGVDQSAVADSIVYPTVPADCEGLAYIHMYYGVTTLTEYNIAIDLRTESIVPSLPFNLYPAGGLTVALTHDHANMAWNGTEFLEVNPTSAFNLSAYVPASADSCCYVLVYVSTSGDLAFLKGSDTTCTSIAFTDIPTPSSDCVRQLWAIKLTYGQTLISRADMLDLRLFSQSGDGSSSTPAVYPPVTYYAHKNLDEGATMSSLSTTAPTVDADWVEQVSISVGIPAEYPLPSDPTVCQAFKVTMDSSAGINVPAGQWKFDVVVRNGSGADGWLRAYVTKNTDTPGVDPVPLFWTTLWNASYTPSYYRVRKTVNQPAMYLAPGEYLVVTLQSMTTATIAGMVGAQMWDLDGSGSETPAGWVMTVAIPDIHGAGTGNMTNPMTAIDQMIVGGASGMPQALAAPTSDTQVLGRSSSTHHVAWVEVPTGTDLGWFNVKNYGALGNGSTDDTVAIQAAINAATAAGGGTIFFPRGTYIVAGALQTLSSAVSAQLVLPTRDPLTDAPLTLRFVGETPPQYNYWAWGAVPPSSGVIIRGTVNSGTTGSLIAGIRAAADRPGAFYHLSRLTVAVKDILFEMPANPVLTCLNFYYIESVMLDNVFVNAGGNYDLETIPEPTTATSYGIAFPERANGAMVWANNVCVTGFYWGFLASEHFTCPNIAVFSCKNAVRFSGSDHTIWIGRLLVQWCQHGLVFDGIATYLKIDLMNIERYNLEWFDSMWCEAVDEILDSGNLGYGDITYYVWAPIHDMDLLLTGGGNLQIHKMTAGIGAGDLVTNEDFDGEGTDDSPLSLSSMLKVTPGTYTNVTVTVDQKGRIKRIRSASGGGEPLMQEGVANPPVPLTNEAGDDWVCFG